jgi:hypothetical protein
MFIRSRYDLLLGRPGTEIEEETKPTIDDEHLIIYGPRRSGRTQALVEDMVNYSRLGNRVCFFSNNSIESDRVRRRVPTDTDIFPRRWNTDRVGVQNGRVFFTYGNLLSIRGLDPDGLYLDDFIQGPDDFSRRRKFFEIVMPLFCHDIRIVIASITKEMPFDTKGWTFRELAPRL